MPLKNGFSEELELASLLIHIQMHNPKDEDSEIYTSIQELRDQHDKLHQEVTCRGDTEGAEQAKQRLLETERQLLRINNERIQRTRWDPGKREMLTQCWGNVGPASQTVGQHCHSIGLTWRVCWDATDCVDLLALQWTFSSERNVSWICATFMHCDLNTVCISK